MFKRRQQIHQHNPQQLQHKISLFIKYREEGYSNLLSRSKANIGRSLHLFFYKEAPELFPDYVKAHDAYDRRIKTFDKSLIPNPGKINRKT